MTTLQLGLAARGAVGAGLATQRGGAAAVPSWWEVAGKTTLRAYASVNAASYAASKINLANPGSGTAMDGTAYPTWTAMDGWILSRAESQFLVAGGLLANEFQTVMIRYSNADGGDSRSGVTTCGVGLYWYGLGLYEHGGVTFPSGGVPSGTSGLSGQQGYLNGVAHGPTITAGTVFAWPVLIGARGGALSAPYSPGQFCQANIQAWIAIQEELSGAEMLALDAAMAAL